MCAETADERERDHMIPSYPPAERPVENTNTPLCSLACTEAIRGMLDLHIVGVINSRTQEGDIVSCASDSRYNAKNHFLIG